MGAEISLILFLASGFGFLWVRHRYRSNRRRLLAAKRGYRYALRGLEELPPQLQETALFVAADGGHERDVLSAPVMVGDESVPVHIFRFRFQREVRGEMVVLRTRPPFRLDSPTTVITFQLPRELGHTLIKRWGPGDRVATLDEDPPRNLAEVAREASGLGRVIAVQPPPGLDGEPLSLPHLTGQYRVWSRAPEIAEQILDRETCGYLCSHAAGNHEWVIELCGPLLVLYCATVGSLSEEDIMAATEFATELCRRVLIATAPLSPRGVELRP